MPVYADIGAVRIQSYLNRTPRLRLRRGASRLLADVTDATPVREWLGARRGVDVNAQAGVADGVVSLEFTQGDVGYARDVAGELMRHLSEQLPAVEWQCGVGTGNTYLDAYDAIHEDRARNAPFLPALVDVPLLETCHECRRDPIVTRSVQLCVDCTAREVKGSDEAVGAEARLHQELVVMGRQPEAARDLGDLAAGGEDAGWRNHLAWVALDGNGMGGFFDATRRLNDPGLKMRLSPLVADATWRALVEATLAAWSVNGEPLLGGTLPVLPHLVGGDDVLVSVVADRAFAFTRRFLTAFNDEMRRADMPEQLQERLPTMSAGIVFMIESFPARRAVELAEGALRHAKREVAGSRASIAWLDVTHDGDDLRQGHTLDQKTLEDLSRAGGALEGLGMLSRSARAELERFAALDDPLLAATAARRWGRRNGQSGLVDLALDKEDISRLRAAVSATRWWRQ